MTSKFSHTCSVNKHQGIIDLMLMALSQNEEEARKVLDFFIKEKDGSIRGANSLEEFLFNLSRNSKYHLKKNF